MSYTIDVYRKKIEASDQLLDFALYVTFFPQLIAGPIVRATEFLPQVKDIDKLSLSDRREGVQLLIQGFFKKVFLADYLAIVVDSMLADPGALNFLTAWLSIYAFAFQIYFDFSGYTDIARGLALLLGFRLPENFNVPYLAANITEFWRRWHMTLSSWLRDYLYISLGGSRKSRIMTYRNLMLTMLIGGLWHGAGWNFIIWGGLHGLYLAAHKIFMSWRKLDPKSLGQGYGWQRILGIIVTFHFVCLAWVFFRMPHFDEALTVIKAMAFLGPGGFDVATPLLTTPFYQTLMIYAVYRLRLKLLSDSSSWLRFVFYGLIAIFLINYVPPGARKFIYFEF
jgi:D-alanyl-lipoteichoic acid acyltransferase DltB (MBOAT superfamily)